MTQFFSTLGSHSLSHMMMLAKVNPCHGMCVNGIGMGVKRDENKGCRNSLRKCEALSFSDAEATHENKHFYIFIHFISVSTFCFALAARRLLMTQQKDVYM